LVQFQDHGYEVLAPKAKIGYRGKFHPILHSRGFSRLKKAKGVRKKKNGKEKI